jgi:hypothetical protein
MLLGAGTKEPPLIRVALMVRFGMLGEILAELLEAQDDMEAAAARGPGEAREGAPAADVVILSADAATQAAEAREVLRRFPACVVLTLAGRSCRASLHELRPHERPVGELSPRRLLQIIRAAASRPEGERPRDAAPPERLPPQRPTMPVTIENQSGARVLLRLNSGRSWYLGPGEALEVEPVEVKGNAWIQHLRERRMISVDPPRTMEEEAPPSVPGGSGGSGPPGRTRRASRAIPSCHESGRPCRHSRPPGST